MAAGRIIASKFVIAAAKRHIQDLADVHTGRRRDLRFDPAAGQHVIDFFGFLHHSKGEWGGSPFRLEPWQQFILWVVFGWKRADGLRRFRTAYVEIPRKNGKSTFSAGVGLYLFFADHEPGAEVYAAATKRDQARIVHSEAVRMVKASPLLRKYVGVFRDNLHVQRTASKFEPLGADSDTLDGLNIHGAIVDELHAHKTRGMWDVLDTATGARRQSLIFAITTAGYDRHSICWEQRSYAEKVLTSIHADDTFFAYIATLDEGDDWEDERNWAKANPNLGVSVKLDDLRRKAQKAKIEPAAQNAFLRLHLNVWTQQDVRWIPLERWDACAAITPKESQDLFATMQRWEVDLRGRKCFGGLDLSKVLDISAFVLLFPPDDDDPLWRVLPYFWVPAENVPARVKRDRVPYDLWIKQGFITATEGNVVDYDAIRERIRELGEEYEITEIAFDRWNATQLVTQLSGDDFEMVEFGQGFSSMSAPSGELMKLILGGKLAHAANPVLRWMSGNVSVEMDAAGNIKPSKKKSPEKIDGIVGLVMATGRAIVSPENSDSVYEQRDILLL